MTWLTFVKREHIMRGPDINLSPLHDVVESGMYGESEWKELSSIRVDLRNGMVWYATEFRVDSDVQCKAGEAVEVAAHGRKDWACLGGARCAG